jgi:hypothetical protein
LCSCKGGWRGRLFLDSICGCLIHHYLRTCFPTNFRLAHCMVRRRRRRRGGGEEKEKQGGEEEEDEGEEEGKERKKKIEGWEDMTGEKGKERK